MAVNTFNLDNTSGSFATIDQTPFGLGVNSGGTYGTTSPTPFSGAGRLSLTSGSSITIRKNSANVGTTTSPTWIDFMAYFLSGIGSLGMFAGGYYYATSASVGCNSSGQFGAVNSSNTFTLATGSPAIPIGEWVRFAWLHQGSPSNFFGESRMYKGANLLENTPSAFVPANTVASEGIAYIGLPSGFSQPMIIDSVIISDEGFPTRVTGPSFSPRTSGQMAY
jgi:hypothetical protein